MQSMLQAVFDIAAKAGVITIAMPLLGAGLAQWPIHLTAAAHIAKVLEVAQGMRRGPLKVSSQMRASAGLQVPKHDHNTRAVVQC